eukprot:COSAG03_NODE_15996_length_414_cov_1.368254_1_plen_105_part_01
MTRLTIIVTMHPPHLRASSASTTQDGWNMEVAQQAEVSRSVSGDARSRDARPAWQRVGRSEHALRTSLATCALGGRLPHCRLEQRERKQQVRGDGVAAACSRRDR